jgi:DNA-binding helix-hairpin-helix protein with protein kinase domain
MANQAYKGAKDTPYLAGRQIGEGGEGTIHEVQGNPALVLKVYKEAVDRDKAEKLLHMTSITDPELAKFAAWPVDVIRDGAGRVSGFVMKKLLGFVPLHMLFSPMDRKKLFPDKGYNFLVHVARNLATAFHKIHQLGIVVGDINEANILVNGTGMVALIDCDSFQVKNGKRYHFCEVGIPRYTPPELLQMGSFENVVRTINTDSFSLATLIFQLLFMGRAPFTGVNRSKEDFDEDKAIKLKEFAYSLQRPNKKLTPAPNSLNLKDFTPGLISSFHAAFDGSTPRPTPRQWVLDLEELNKEMVNCNRSRLHYYSKSMQQCPWCAFRDRAGIVYFMEDAHLKNIPELQDIEQFVNGFKLENLEIRKLADTYTSGTIKARPVEQKFKTLFYINITVQIIALLITLSVSMTESWWFAFAGALFLLLYNTLAPAQKQLKAELKSRKADHEVLQNKFQALVKKHNQPTELNRYNQSAKKLTDLITAFRSLPADFAAKKRMIEEKYYNIKYQVHLLQFDIRNYPIPSFGAAKKQLIYTNGIHTAADMYKLKTHKISGIGPKNIQVLLDWQRQMGSGFTYTPDTEAIDREINFIANEIYIKKRKLENDIKAEYKGLSTLRAGIITATELLERQYVQLGTKLYQSRVDVEAFEKIAGKWF